MRLPTLRWRNPSHSRDEFPELSPPPRKYCRIVVQFCRWRRNEDVACPCHEYEPMIQERNRTDSRIAHPSYGWAPQVPILAAPTTGPREIEGTWIIGRARSRSHSHRDRLR